MSSSADWFSRKMGAPAPQTQQQPVYQQPVQQQVPMQTMPQQQQQQHPMTASGRCPGCGSNNYAKVGVSATQSGSFEVYRCYDCGYPVQQTGSGVSSTGGTAAGGPAIPAKQVPTGGFNPTTIIGHI